MESGIIKRALDGRFYEVHQPPGPVDDYGHPVPPEYIGCVVPKTEEPGRCPRAGDQGPLFPIEAPAKALVSPAVPPIATEKREEITQAIE